MNYYGGQTVKLTVTMENKHSYNMLAISTKYN